MKNDYLTPRDRVDEDLLRRLLAEDSGNDARPAAAISVNRSEGCCTAHKYNRTGKEKQTAFPFAGVSLAMVYSPYHEFTALYEPHEGLARGTIFSELEKPFYPTPCGTYGCGCQDSQKEGW